MQIERVKERIKNYDGQVILDVYGFDESTGFIVLSFTRNGSIEGELTIRGSREELRDLARFLQRNMGKIFEGQRKYAHKALREILT